MMDPVTEYRYYSREQIGVYQRIALLKELGCELQTIRQLLSSHLGPEEWQAILEEQACHIRKQIQRHQQD